MIVVAGSVVGGNGVLLRAVVLWCGHGRVEIIFFGGFVAPLVPGTAGNRSGFLLAGAWSFFRRSAGMSAGGRRFFAS